MIVIKLKGGLGNQMFQYAMYLYTKKVLKKDVYLDKSYYSIFSDKVRTLRINNLKTELNFIRKSKLNELIYFKKLYFNKNTYKIGIILNLIFNQKYLLEKNVKNFKINNEELFLDGYWQNKEILKDISDDLKQHFKYKNKHSENFLYYKEIMETKDSIFIGVRRGDYKLKKNKKIFGFLGKDYFHNAMKIINSKIKNPHYFIFSDDVNQVKKDKLFDYKNVTFIDKELNDDVEEMILMSKAKHAIISNSTFNFWAAWMIGNNQKVVVSPNPWYINSKVNEFIDNQWLKVKR